MPNQASVKDLITEARTKIDNLPAAEMARALEASDVLLVDVREPAERAEHGTIPGALAAPRGMLAMMVLGFVWYAPWSPTGKIWLRHMGLDPDNLTPPPGLFFVNAGFYLVGLLVAGVLLATVGS